MLKGLTSTFSECILENKALLSLFIYEGKKAVPHDFCCKLDISWVESSEGGCLSDELLGIVFSVALDTRRMMTVVDKWVGSVQVERYKISCLQGAATILFANLFSK